MNTARPSDGSQYLQSVSYTSSVLMWIFIFAKWVNDDSQFLTLVVTVWVCLELCIACWWKFLTGNFDLLLTAWQDFQIALMVLDTLRMFDDLYSSPISFMLTAVFVLGMQHNMC